MQYLIYFLQSFILITLTPFFLGLLKRLKANFRGYNGPSIFQTYYDLAKLFKKGRVVSSSSSFITKIAPSFMITVSITVAFIIPVFYTNQNSYLGNIFIVFFLLTINKFLSTLLGLDAASTFGGMGSSRELFISSFAEPIMFLIIAYLYVETNSFNIYDICYLNSKISIFGIAHIIASLAFFMLIIAENARMPVDNPETHLELTMIHEAMILESSGKDLAMVELSANIKLIIFLTIFINCFFPFSIATEISVVILIKSFIIFSLKLITSLILISVIEVGMAKFRLFRVPEILAMALSLEIVSIAIIYFV